MSQFQHGFPTIPFVDSIKPSLEESLEPLGSSLVMAIAGVFLVVVASCEGVSIGGHENVFESISP
jgi:hypothetical protein